MYFMPTFTHTKKMKKIVKKCLLSVVLVAFAGVTFCGSVITVKYLKYKSLPLDVQALSDSVLSIDIYAKDNTKIEDVNQFNGSNIKIEELSEHTKQAFISIEDKDFYKHKGINKKRILKATLNNLKSFSFKEGASTITQQLIKNTHLSSEKTIDRKLKEIALAQKLEKNLGKDEILESYLNIIFFGNNCYGIENASQYYFGKSASDLDIAESCTLAGIIKSPTRYSPISNHQNCLERRNLVISEMEKDGHITEEEKLVAIKTPLTLHITPHATQNRLNSYSQASLDEASKLLSLPAKQIALAEYKIHTYYDDKKSQDLATALSQNKIDGIDNAGIVIDNKSHGIVAYHANSNLKFYDIKRQPASCIKPLLVYGPALNENVISPQTQILDEKIKIGNYEPENVNKSFGGYMSVTDAVKNSVNIPAIKTLSYIGIDTGKAYAEKLDIDFDEKDDSYALALGGMTYGVTLHNLAGAYTVFANNGNYSAPTFIEYITDKNGRIVYLHRPQEKMIFREDSAYLMTNILQESAKSGTARKLSDISNTEIASKTGTAGRKAGNTDAYNISVTPEETIGVWFGSLDNSPAKIAGGNQPTSVVKEYVSKQEFEKKEFDIPSSITTAKIDSMTKEAEHRIVIASPHSPDRFTEKALFSRFNMPTEVSSNFSEEPKITATCTVKNGQIVLCLTAQRHIEYQIYKNNIPYQCIKNKDGDLTIKMPATEKEETVKIIAKYENDAFSNLQNEKTFTLSGEKHQNIKTKWYI